MEVRSKSIRNVPSLKLVKNAGPGKVTNPVAGPCPRGRAVFAIVTAAVLNSDGSTWLGIPFTVWKGAGNAIGTALKSPASMAAVGVYAVFVCAARLWRVP